MDGNLQLQASKTLNMPDSTLLQHGDYQKEILMQCLDRIEKSLLTASVAWNVEKFQCLKSSNLDFLPALEMFRECLMSVESQKQRNPVPYKEVVKLMPSLAYNLTSMNYILAKKNQSLAQCKSLFQEHGGHFTFKVFNGRPIYSTHTYYSNIIAYIYTCSSICSI